jgi:hypothetical protein
MVGPLFEKNPGREKPVDKPIAVWHYMNWSL